MPITPDTLATFPVIPNYGFRARPTYRNRHTERESGFERINRVWSRPLLHITGAPFEDAEIAEAEAIANFWHAMGGSATYFRFRDYSDFQSVGTLETPGPLDQPLIEIGATGTYQLVKQYVVDSIVQLREIFKPIGSTIRVANESLVEQDVDDWTLDEATGILTPGGGFSGTPTTWGGEFDVEVRFVSDGMQIDLTTFGTRGIQIAMRERRRAATV